MYKLEVPKVLKRGDTIALISISGGRAGDEDMLYRYEVGKKRLEEIWGIHVIPTPNALAGNNFLYEHPEARAEDLMWAMQDKKINGIICMMGGDDSYRVLPYIDLNVIKSNPKVFMGYSDITSWMAVFAKAGIRAYYGPNLLTPIAQPVSLDKYTKEAITKCLFSTEVIGNISACSEYTNIEWRNVGKDEIKWVSNTGYRFDVENKMLERAESFCDNEKVEFLLCDVRELLYQEMFDIVTAVQVNHYFKKEERMAAIKKYYNALKDDGIYIFFENFAPDSEEGTRLYLKRWKEFQIANGKTKEEADLHIKRYGQNYFPITISESIRLLKACGFRMVEILWASYMQVGILARK